MTAGSSGGDPVIALWASLSAALAAGTREAFSALLTDDVRWGGQHGGNECITRDQAADHYAGLIAAGVSVRLASPQPTGADGGDVLLVRLQIQAPDHEEFPPEITVGLTVRDGLIADIRELDSPARADDPDQEAAVTAIHGGDLGALRQLLAAHPELATARLAGHGGRTLLHVATDWPGHYPNVAATITLLIRAGADPNVPALGAHAETPLHWAASSDDVAAIDALLDGGADINAPGAVIAGGTPMADATAFGQWHAARRLLERGAATSLFEAAALGLVAEVRRRLDTSAPTAEEITGSFWGACHGGQLATAAVLLDHGADINWVGYDDLTPLDAAHRSEASAVVGWLEQHGATTAGHPA